MIYGRERMPVPFFLRKGVHMLVLICREACEDGSLVFTIYDTDSKKVTRYTNAELMPLVASKHINNAKLENSVIKITDSRRSLQTISYEQGKTDSAFYVIKSYVSPVGSNMYAVVSNRGNIFEFSESMAEEFFNTHFLVNAYFARKGMHVINVPTFSSALQKSLEHINNH